MKNGKEVNKMNTNVIDFTNEFIKKFHLKEINKDSSKDQYLLALIKAGSIMASLTKAQLTSTSLISQTLENWFSLLNINTFPIHRLIEDKNLKDIDLSWLNYFYNDNNSPFIPELLFYSSLATLLNDSSLSSEQINSGLKYLKEIEKILNLESDFTLTIKGWITNKSDSDINQVIEQIFQSIKENSLEDEHIIESLFKNIQSSKNNIEINEEIDEKEWTKIKINLNKKLQTLANKLDTFNLDLYKINEFNQVKNFIENSLFRISVLGEFKRGKSTLINSLLGTVDLVPAATLPCTSGLIEVKYGDKEKYYLNDDGPLGKYNEIERYDFIHNSGNAHTDIETRQISQKEYQPEGIKRWKVEYDSNFLKDYQIQLIDTPGLNESPLRDMMSLEEAQYTDAAIFVLDASHQAALTELNFLEKIKPLSKNIIFAINRGDLINPNNRDEIIPYIYSRVKNVLPDIPKENFILISSKAIEESIRNKPFPDQEFWINQFEQFKKIVNSHLLKKAAPRRLEKITLMVNSLEVNLGNTLNNLLQEKKNAVNEFSELNLKYIRQQIQKDELLNDIKLASEIIKNDWSDCASVLVTSVNKTVIPQSLNKLYNDQSNWKSEHNPVFSGKKHITEIAKQAEERIQIFIKGSLENSANPIISNKIDSSLNKASNKIENKLSNFLNNSKKKPEDIVEEIKKQTFKNFVNISGIDLDPTGSIFFGAALTTIISSIVGYIVADIVLYYILGIISGFLNPYLLAAAIVLAIVGILWKGKGVVSSFIKSKVYDKFSEKLSSKETHEKIEKGVKENIKKIFEQIAESFSIGAKDVIDEIDYQRKNIRKEIEELTNKYGTSKEELEKIINKMDCDKEEALLTLKSIINDISQTAETKKKLLALIELN